MVVKWTTQNCDHFTYLLKEREIKEDINYSLEMELSDLPYCDKKNYTYPNAP